ncbi:MAG: tetratricopeptide repeat protein [Burkholderiales bacterium]|nr:tetratricopeptide repeat protein [Burkholderiales bacterium]
MIGELLARLFKRPAHAGPAGDPLAEAAALLESGRLAEAAHAAEAIIGQQPDHPYARIVLARTHARHGRVDEARSVLDRALAAHPEIDHVWAERAELERQAGNADAAVAIYRRALERGRGSPAILVNLGGLLLAESRAEEAVEVLKRASELDPAQSSHRLQLGRAQLNCGDLAGAERSVRRAVELDPGARGPRFWLAHVLLMQGRMAEGWAEYETRLAQPGFAWGTAGLPRWDGSDPRGMRLRVIAEQGLGDSIMFARFIPHLIERGAAVQFLCRRTMQRLFQASFNDQPVEVIADPDADAAGVTAHVHLMSLPYLLALPRAALRAERPYLRLPAGLADAWHAKVHAALGDARPRLKVGLMWAGNPDRSRDEDRSLPIEVAGRLGTAAHGIAWFNLQVDTERDRGAQHPFPMIDLTHGMSDYAESAGLIDAMDLVISVDTSTAHAAAALGARLWLLAPHNVCWRWLIAGEESPWYPGVRLFRAARPREWAPVVERICGELAALAAARGS